MDELDPRDVEVQVDVDLAVILRERNDPVFCGMTLKFPNPDMLPSSVEQFTDCVTGEIIDKLIDRSEVLIVFEDKDHNKKIFRSERIDAVQVFAPTALPKEFRHGDD